MSTTSGTMKSFKVTDKDGNVFIMTPVDTVARQAIDEAKNLEFDDDYFTSEVSQDQTTVSVGLNGVPLGIDSDSPLKFVQDSAQGIVFGSDAPYSTALAPEYDSTATYAVGDSCMHLGKYYRCNTAISSAEAWNSTHWTETSLIDGLATVAKTGSYNDLSNTPTIPPAQVNADWDAVSGVAQILNKPSLSTVATTGNYTDLNGTPTIGDGTLSITVGSSQAQTFTANQTSNESITIPLASVDSSGATPVYSEGLMSANDKQKLDGIDLTGYQEIVSSPTANDIATLDSNGQVTDSGRSVSSVLGQEAIAPEYDSTATYAVGDTCTYQGKYYSCSTAISTAEAWDSTHWTETDVESVIASSHGIAVFDCTDYSGSPFTGPTLAELDAARAALKTIVLRVRSGMDVTADTYYCLESYSFGRGYFTYVFSESRYGYIRRFEGNASDTSTHVWTFAGVGEYSVYQESIAPSYSSSRTYSVGDAVMYNGRRYVCNADISSAEQWNSSHWTETSVEASRDVAIFTGYSHPGAQSWPDPDKVIDAYNAGKMIIIIIGYQSVETVYIMSTVDEGLMSTGDEIYMFERVNRPGEYLMLQQDENHVNWEWSTYIDQRRNFDTSSIAPIFSSTGTYDVGDAVMYNGKRYVSNVAQTMVIWNSANWTQKSVEDELGNIETLLAAL